MKRLYARLFYRFAVFIECFRYDFLDFQYAIMEKIVKFRNKFQKNTEDNSKYVDELYKTRFENWEKFIFLKDPNKSWVLNWYRFFLFL